MKKLLGAVAAFLLASLSPVLAHSDNELGPNGGRILEFSADQTIHGEVTLTNGMFHVAILDKDMKPMALKDQSLTVMGGDRTNPQKPEVRKEGNHFVFPALKGDEYLLAFQFKPTPTGKSVTARFEFDAMKCPTCKKQEWLCDCGLKAKAEKEKKGNAAGKQQ